MSLKTDLNLHQAVMSYSLACQETDFELNEPRRDQLKTFNVYCLPACLAGWSEFPCGKSFFQMIRAQ